MCSRVAREGAEIQRENSGERGGGNQPIKSMSEDVKMKFFNLEG